MMDDCPSAALRWLSLSALALTFACSDKNEPGAGSTGGSAGTSSTSGGAAGNAGGVSNGGTAGSASGGAPATGGSAAAGGSAAMGGGGAAGASGSGAGSGATAGGGAGGSSGATAGSSAGGSSGAGSGGGGSAGTGGKGGSSGTFSGPFMLGADISSVQEGNATFRDTDGQTKTIFALLKNHGFNTIRIKAFVAPNAPYGYASTQNGCPGMDEPFGDKAHVVAYGQQIKAAGMRFLLDFHYSDVWADPGNQIIPDPWRNATSITDLAARMKAYTVDVLTTAVAAGARPDMVQVGNEITPGMLMHGGIL